MNTVIRTPLGRLRAIGLAEGMSFVLLLGIAMPLKYMFDMPEYVRVIGSIHGLLWIAFLAALFDTWSSRRWPWRRVAVAFVASVTPFGPFVLDRSLREEQRADDAEGQLAGAIAAGRWGTIHRSERGQTDPT